MSFTNETTKKPWPRWGVHKETGERAFFHCPADMGRKYRLEEPLPSKPLQISEPSRDATIAELLERIKELEAGASKKGKAAA